MTRQAWIAGFATMVLGCGGHAPVTPAAIDTRNDVCASCRMTVSNPRLAAQVAAPGEEPRFFDDIGCLATYLKAHPRLPEGAVAYVADHRTGAWIAAARALYTRVPDLSTPMESHLVAHTDDVSRAADMGATPGRRAAIDEIFDADALEAVTR